MATTNFVAALSQLSNLWGCHSEDCLLRAPEHTVPHGCKCPAYLVLKA